MRLEEAENISSHRGSAVLECVGINCGSAERGEGTNAMQWIKIETLRGAFIGSGRQWGTRLDVDRSLGVIEGRL
jgi:hypothetical protein